MASLIPGHPYLSLCGVQSNDLPLDKEDNQEQLCPLKTMHRPLSTQNNAQTVFSEMMAKALLIPTAAEMVL